MTFRKLINTIHLWLGLASGAILIIVAATGCILAFEDEIRDSTQQGLMYATPVPGQRRLGVDSILNVIHTYDSKAVVTQLRYFGEADKAVQCYTKDKKIYAIDPYAAKVLGYRDQGRDFLFVVLSLHRTLLLGKVGEEIIFWNVWLFLIMLLSGLVLWWPRRLKQIRQAMVI